MIEFGFKVSIEAAADNIALTINQETAILTPIEALTLARLLNKVVEQISTERP